jgi:hypothetical protein
MRHFAVLNSEMALDNYFYSKEVVEYIKELWEVFGEKCEIQLFPEATIKANKVPNGLLLKSQIQLTWLLPALLRDPGCGFLLFKLSGIKKNHIKTLSHSLVQFCDELIVKKPLNNILIKEAFLYGVSSKSLSHDKYTDTIFPVSTQHLYLDFSLDMLHKDLSQITNSLELKISEIQLNSYSNKIDLFGFVHTGSDYLPKIIYKQWFKRVADYALTNNISSIEQINKGIYGVCDDSEEGMEYQQSIFAAMNFCLYKRWWIYNQLKGYLCKNHKLEIQLINDKCHAGLFRSTNEHNNYLLQARGVQIVKNQKDDIFLMAGHKESVSFLFQGVNADFLGHGTSYSIDSKINYDDLLPHSLKYDLSSVIANTKLNSDSVLPYNYNIHIQKEFYKRRYSKCTTLFPVMNYQGYHLRENNL